MASELREVDVVIVGAGHNGLTAACYLARAHVDTGLFRAMGPARPASGMVGYRAPIPGLWLTGIGTHPGGGVSGPPGRNAVLSLSHHSPTMTIDLEPGGERSQRIGAPTRG